MAFFPFDASAVAPQQAYTPIPAGTYIAHIVESDVQPLKSGAGLGMKLVFEILDGQHKNRKVIERYNVEHTNAQTQQIAQSQVSALCHAIGVIKPQQTQELHLRPCKIIVGVRAAQGDFGPSNTIKGYESASGVAMAPFTAPTQGHAPQQQSPTATMPAASVPAWAQKKAA